MDIRMRALDRLQRRIQKYGAEVGDTLTFNRRLGIKVLQQILLGFRKSGLEKRWTPLAPSTAFARRQGKKASLGSKPLLDTGFLQKSFRFQANRIEVRIGSSSILAAVHHFGRKPREIRPKKQGGVLAFKHPQISSSGPPRPPTKGPFKNILFTRFVKKQTIPARPIFPSIPLQNRLRVIVEKDFFKEASRKSGLGATRQG